MESRFGLVPTFHHEPLGRFPSPAWVRYLEQKASSRYHNNCIGQQLDLLYEFCQWALEHFHPLAPLTDGTHIRLWRGSNRCEEQLVGGVLQRGQRRVTMQLNNLISFSLDREGASCFGDWILEARVPLSKLLFFPGLLPGRTLHGEGEALVIGGDYELDASYE